MRNKLAVPFHHYGQGGCNLKMIVQMSIYNIVSNKKRSGFEVVLMWLL